MKLNKKKKEKPLTPRERKMVKDLVAGKSKKEALMSAGYSEQTALKNPSVILGKNRIQTAFQKLMEKKGLTDGKLLGVLGDGLKAKRVVSAVILGTDTHDFVEVDDHQTRHKFLDTALKLKNRYPAEKHELDITVETYEQRLRRLRGLLPEGGN